METLDKYLKQNIIHKMEFKYALKMMLEQWHYHRHYDKVFKHHYLSNN